MQSSQVVYIVLFPVDRCAVAPAVVAAAGAAVVVVAGPHRSGHSGYLNFKTKLHKLNGIE